jgi:hypothetical protein
MPAALITKSWQNGVAPCIDESVSETTPRVGQKHVARSMALRSTDTITERRVVTLTKALYARQRS